MAWIPAVAGIGSMVSKFFSDRNSSAKADRNRALGGWGEEQNVFNYALPLAKDLNAQGQNTVSRGLTNVDTGLGTLAGVKQYFQNIFSGARPATLAAVAPEINQINQMSDAARASQAWFGTARGGGTNAANQEAEIRRQAAIDNAIFAARPGAASETAKIGEAESRIGLGKAGVGIEQLASGLRALGIGEEAIQHFIDSSNASRRDSTAINQQSQSDWRTMASDIFSQIADAWKRKGAQL